MRPELRKLVTSPIGQGDLAAATVSAEGENPVCGDRLRFAIRIEDGRIAELRFRATACPATIAVASCAVSVLGGSPVPLSSPIETLRNEVQRRGGLSRFEQHALALVEDVLGRCR